MNQAKQAAARSWRSTLSSGEVQVKGPEAGGEGEGPESAVKHEGDKNQDKQCVQRQAQEARSVQQWNTEVYVCKHYVCT